MTANFRTADYAPPAVDAGVARAPRTGVLANLTDRAAFCALIAALLLMYGLLQNRYWVPAGDSELYAAAARNIATGKGYTFLGQPVAISPPGWSWMMAAMMPVTPYILPLKLLAMSCLIASLAIGYWIARRFTTPAKAAAVILLTAIISHVYQATFWLISEGSFCLATSASILLAMQIAEGRREIWRVALLLFCCAAAVSIRWAGVLGVIIVVAALLDRQWKPRLTAPWVTSGLVVLVSVLTFYGWRYGMYGTPEEIAAAANIVTGTGEDVGTVEVSVAPPVSGTAGQAAGRYELFPSGSYADRFLKWGRWFSFLYWQPFRAAGAKASLLATASAAGWMIIAVLGVLVVFATRQLRWIWLATGIYTGALAIGWPNINARYYVPVAFMITLGIFLATDELTALAAARPRLRKFLVGCFAVFIASVAVCNTALYLVEVAIARSDRFYARYETGMNAPLIAACQHLNNLPPAEAPRDNQIAVSPRYMNLNKTRASPFGIRAAVWLTGKKVITPKWSDNADPPNASSSKARNLRAWLKKRGVKWYLYQPEISPWRVWHFRLGWYEKWQVGTTAEKDTSGWRLYRYAGGDEWTQVRLPGKCQPVTRVPGLGE